MTCSPQMGSVDRRIAESTVESLVEGKLLREAAEANIVCSSGRAGDQWSSHVRGWPMAATLVLWRHISMFIYFRRLKSRCTSRWQVEGLATPTNQWSEEV